MKLCLDDYRCSRFSYRLIGLGLCFIKRAPFNGFRARNFARDHR